jgi:AraC-like DNA-binding protein
MLTWSRLLLISDWVERGRQAHYKAAELASLCKVSPSQLRRFYLDTFFRPPQEWLDELRVWDAMEILASGCSVKETAYKLAFSDATHLSHAFKRYHGFSPAACERFVHKLFSTRPVLTECPPWISARFALLSPLHTERFRARCAL